MAEMPAWGIVTTRLGCKKDQKIRETKRPRTRALTQKSGKKPPVSSNEPSSHRSSTMNERRVSDMLSMLSSQGNSSPRAPTKKGADVKGTTSCRPYSKEDYLTRLKTYSAGNWFGKPDSVTKTNPFLGYHNLSCLILASGQLNLQVSPPVCALHGWFNSKMDELKCEASWYLAPRCTQLASGWQSSPR